MMDAREKSEKEQLQFDCQSYHVPLIDEAPLFPVSSLRGNNCCVSGLYLDGRPNHSHDINLFNGHLQKMFSLEQIFFSIMQIYARSFPFCTQLINSELI